MFEKDATEVANMVKKIDSSIIVILGGVTATLPEIYISLLHNNDVYDIMSRGEGEYTFIDLLRNYNKKEKKIDKRVVSDIIYKLEKSERPVVFVGNGVRLAGAHDKFLKLIIPHLYSL